MDIFTQVTIPLLILLAMRVKTRKALLMLPFTMVIDLDVFFRAHRMLFHNLFVALIIPLIITIYIKKYKPKYLDYAWIAFFYVFASLIFDLSDGVALLYPLLTDFYYLQISMYIQFIGPIPLPDFNLNYGVWMAEQTVSIGEHLGAAETASRYPSMSDTSTGLLFTLIVAAVMYFEKSRVFLNEVIRLVKDIFQYVRKTLFSLFQSKE